MPKKWGRILRRISGSSVPEKECNETDHVTNEKLFAKNKMEKEIEDLEKSSNDSSLDSKTRDGKQKELCNKKAEYEAIYKPHECAPDHVVLLNAQKTDRKREPEPQPVPVQILAYAGESLKLNIEGLDQIFKNPKVSDKKICIVGVTGSQKSGKSLLLNYMLRFLRWSTKADKVPKEVEKHWLSPNMPSTGFLWRGGSEQGTPDGIHIWSEAFVLKDKNGEETAVFLMDTQGAFDPQLTVKDYATIFSLSTMISSVQIFNLSQNIQEDVLQHLQLVTEYGRLALKDSASKPFQSLLFLVRDWSSPYEAGFGFEGGQKVLDRRFEVFQKQHVEHQQLHQQFRSCFEDIRCFLMPHPGIKATTNPYFDGRLCEISTYFKDQLKVFVHSLLDSGTLIQKENNGRKMTGSELSDFVKDYMKNINAQHFPEHKSILQATAEANNLAAAASARAIYQKKMEYVCGGDASYMSTKRLLEQHLRCKSIAIREFRNSRKMGGDEFSLKFLEILENDLEEKYETYLVANNLKNKFEMKTPALLICALFVGFILCEVFQNLGLYFFATMCIWIQRTFIVQLAVWSFSRYVGREGEKYVDEVVAYVWNNFICHNQSGELDGAIRIGEADVIPGPKRTRRRNSF